MLIEQLFSSGLMTMGPSRIDPSRRVGVFTPRARELMTTRAAELDAVSWIIGKWSYENEVNATRVSPLYIDVGTVEYDLADDGWICAVSPDGRLERCLTFDPLSGQWIYALTRGSYGVLRSRDRWKGRSIVFTGLMTMVGIDCEWRMTWERLGDDRFRFVNEERLKNGAWGHIDQWEFRRVEGPTVVTSSVPALEA